MCLREGLTNWKWLFIGCFVFIYSLQATWLTSEDISLPGQDAANPQIVVDTRGNVTVVWEEFNGRHTVIQAATKSFVGKWQIEPTPLSLPEQDAFAPKIAIDPHGNVSAVWYCSNGKKQIIQASTKSLDGNWQAVPSSLSLAGQDAFDPQIVVDTEGNATAVWYRFDGKKYRIQACIKRLGGSWLVVPRNLSVAGQNAIHPRLAVDAAGNVTAIWIISDDSKQMIQASTKLFGGGWQTVPDVLSALGQEMFDPQIAVDPVGNAIAVWSQLKGNNRMIQASTKLFGGSWQAVPDTLSLPEQSAITPQIVLDLSGNATVIWERLNGSHSMIQASCKRFGNSWQAVPDNLSTVGQNAINPQLAVDSTGHAHVIWMSVDGNDKKIQFSRKALVGKWQAVPDLLSASGQSSFQPQIVIDTSGNSFAVWQTFKGSHFIVQTSRRILPPHISSLSPLYAPTNKETEVSINGTNFLTTTAVYFGDYLAKDFVVNSGTLITALAPPGNVETVDVSVKTLGGTSLLTAESQYTYFELPHVVSLDVMQGPIEGETEVTIEGIGFETATQVNFGDQPALSFVVNSDTSITALAPPGESGTVNVYVTTVVGISQWTAENEYTYFDLPIVTSLDFMQGPTSGETEVTMEGSGFETTTQVYFGDHSALSFVVNSDTSMTAIAPPGDEGTINVFVMTLGGISQWTAENEYTYFSPIFPPSKLKGKKSKGQFATFKLWVTTISWEPPPQGIAPTSYAIYRDADLTHLVTTISAKEPLKFKERKQMQNQEDTYFIVSISQTGAMSTPAWLVVY